MCCDRLKVMRTARLFLLVCVGAEINVCYKSILEVTCLINKEHLKCFMIVTNGLTYETESYLAETVLRLNFAELSFN